MVPGTCRLDPTRLCSSNADCNIEDYDLSSVGSCGGAAAGTFNGNSIRLIAEGNVLSGVYDMGALFANQTDGFVFRGNRVDGGANGIRILSLSVNGSIERNIVSGSATALYLGFATSFTQRIRLNDFVNYSVAIRASNDFATMTDISLTRTTTDCYVLDSTRPESSSTMGASIPTCLTGRRTVCRWQPRRTPVCRRDASNTASRGPCVSCSVVACDEARLTIEFWRALAISLTV